LGKLVEIDWRSLFGSFFFFAMIRINVKCSKVPRQKIMEMADDIYLFNFKKEKMS